MKNKNLKECPSGKQVKKVSHWANLKHINPLSFIQLLNRRVFFWIFRRKIRAVLTVEAAFVVPMFLLASCTLMGLLDCYRIQSIVKTSIHQSAMELGMYAYGVDKEEKGIDVINSAICIAYAQTKLPEMEDHVSVSMAASHYENNTVTLVATIKYKFPISLFPIPSLKLTNVSEVHSWVGNQQETESEVSSVTYEMVYVTENQSVYHTSSSCSHLDIKIYETKKKKVDDEKMPCQKCCKTQELENDEVVYYTKTGECYHIQKDCGSLKRIVRLVEFSQVKNLPLCERCEKRGNL